MSKFDKFREDLKTVPCVGCGYCCKKAPCAGAVRIYGNVTKCPALEWDGAKYRCHLCTLPGKLGAEYRKELFIGEGCCCGLNTDRLNILPPEEPKTAYRMSPDFQAFLKALCHGGGLGCNSDMVWLAANQAAHETNNPALLSEVVRFFKEGRTKFAKEFMG